jgi:raffinose/stachyose/melibiose transport system substrate-binding protein
MSRQLVLRFVFFGILAIIAFTFFYKEPDTGHQTSQDIASSQIEIRFSSSWGGIDTKAEILEEIIEDFEKAYPSIKIINESISGEDYLFILKADFASGNGPDIFGLWPGSDLKRLIEEEFVADINDVVLDDRNWFQSFDQRAFSAINPDSRIYSVPFEIIYEGLFLNLDLFEKHNVKVPQDFDELLTAIKMFKAVNITPIAYNSTPEGSFIYQNIVASLGSKEQTELPIQTGRIQDNYEEAMLYMRQLYQAGAFPKNFITLDDFSRNQLFLNKDAAMIVQGSWFMSNDLDDSIGIIPFPIDASKKHVIYGIGNGNFHINQQTYNDPEKREAVVTFLKYLTSENSRGKFESLPGFVTSDNAISGDYLKDLGYSLINEADELIGPPDHYINRSWWEEVLIYLFPSMLEGEIEPEDIFNQLKEY